MIQAWDVDLGKPRPDGWECEDAKRHPTGLTDDERERVRPFLPPVAKRGLGPEVDMREMLNAVRYMARSGGGWRMLPTNSGAWQVVCWWFRRFVRRPMFRIVHDVALMPDRERIGRDVSPMGGVLHSRTAKAPSAATRGCDANKKIMGRKCRVAVDADGRLLMVNLTTADISDSADAQTILDTIRKRWAYRLRRHTSGGSLRDG